MFAFRLLDGYILNRLIEHRVIKNLKPREG